jgi:GNAT superfamily N-acetyltransferase
MKKVGETLTNRNGHKHRESKKMALPVSAFIAILKDHRTYACVIFSVSCFLLKMIVGWYIRHVQLKYLQGKRVTSDEQLISLLSVDAPQHIKNQIVDLLHDEWPGSGNRYLQESYDMDAIVLIMSKIVGPWKDVKVIGHVRMEPAPGNILRAHRSMSEKKNVNNNNNSHESYKNELSKNAKPNSDIVTEVMVVQGLMVSQEERRHGYGKLLMSAIETTVKLTKCCRHIYLSANGTRNIQFYRSCDYTELSVDQSPMLPRGFTTNITTTTTTTRSHQPNDGGAAFAERECEVVWFYKPIQ